MIEHDQKYSNKEIQTKPKSLLIHSNTGAANLTNNLGVYKLVVFTNLDLSDSSVDVDA
jgi:hypothetical protein